jgi:hypothetical protein
VYGGGDDVSDAHLAWTHAGVAVSGTFICLYTEPRRPAAPARDWPGSVASGAGSRSDVTFKRIACGSFRLISEVRSGAER